MQKGKIRDERVVAIINDPLLPGWEKARRISLVIKNRTAIQVQSSLVEVDKPHALKKAWIADGFNQDGIEIFIGVEYCTDCRAAYMIVSSTTNADTDDRVRRSDVRLSTDIGKLCDEGGNDG